MQKSGGVDSAVLATVVAGNMGRVETKIGCIEPQTSFDGVTEVKTL